MASELSRDTGLWVLDLAATLDSVASTLHARADQLRDLPASPPNPSAFAAVEADVDQLRDALRALVEGGAWANARDGIADEEQAA